MIDNVTDNINIALKRYKQKNGGIIQALQLLSVC